MTDRIHLHTIHSHTYAGTIGRIPEARTEEAAETAVDLEYAAAAAIEYAVASGPHAFLLLTRPSPAQRQAETMQLIDRYQRGGDPHLLQVATPTSTSSSSSSSEARSVRRREEGGGAHFQWCSSRQPDYCMHGAGQIGRLIDAP